MFIKRYSCFNIFLQHIYSVIFLRIQEIHEHRQAIYMLCIKYWTSSYLLCQVDESGAVICLLDRKPWHPNLKNMFITSGQIVVLPKSFRVRFLQSPELMEWMFAVILRCLFFFGKCVIKWGKKWKPKQNKAVVSSPHSGKEIKLMCSLACCV